MIKDRCQAIARSKWFLPLFSLGLGGVVLLASWLGGQLGAGVYGLVVLAVFGLVLLLLSGRSETIRGLTTGRDERFAMIDLRATAVAEACADYCRDRGVAGGDRPWTQRQPVWLARRAWRPCLYPCRRVLPLARLKTASNSMAVRCRNPVITGRGRQRRRTARANGALRRPRVTRRRRGWPPR
jgi:hypothetical protein